MAGLNLTQAVQNFQQGTQWRQQQDDRAKQQAAMKVREDADRAFASTIDASKAEWALNGAQGEYKPNDTTMFKAAEARGLALLKGNDVQGYLKNEASVQQQRIRVRQGALQQYEMDGDFEALARKAYPTVFDGKEIVGAERLGGMPALDSIDRPATPTEYKFKLSDGSTQTVKPEDMVKRLKLSLVDPVTAAEQEVKLNYQRALERIKGEEDRATAREKAGLKVDEIREEGRVRGETLKTEYGFKGSLADADRKFKATESALDRTSEEKRTNTSAAATRYSADQSLAGAKVRADGEGKDSGKAFDRFHDEVIRTFGERMDGPLGGPRIGSEDTMKIASYAQALAEEEGIPMGVAIGRSIEEFKKRKPAQGARK